jgi:hypothetical protein
VAGLALIVSLVMAAAIGSDTVPQTCTRSTGGVKLADGSHMVALVAYDAQGPHPDGVLWASPRGSASEPDLSIQADFFPTGQALGVPARLRVVLPPSLGLKSGSAASELVLIADGVEFWRGPYPESVDTYGWVVFATRRGEFVERPELLDGFMAARRLVVELRTAEGAVVASSAMNLPDAAGWSSLYSRAFYNSMAMDPPEQGCLPPSAGVPH